MNVMRENIYLFGLWDILKTQYIDAQFAVDYILNKSYQLLEEEMKITYADVVHYQPHITIKDLFIPRSKNLTSFAPHGMTMTR